MATSKLDLNVDLNYRQLADRHDFDELHAFYDENLRLVDLVLRRKHKPEEVARVRKVARIYQQAIKHKEAEGQ